MLKFEKISSRKLNSDIPAQLMFSEQMQHFLYRFQCLNHSTSPLSGSCVVGFLARSSFGQGEGDE